MPPFGSSVLKDGAKVGLFIYPCKLFARFLLGDEQEIVLLAALNEQVLVVEQVGSGDLLVEGSELLLVHRYATTLGHLAHFTL